MKLISKYQTGDKILEQQLPEVTVQPTDKQLDFHNNFGTSEIRMNVLNKLKKQFPFMGSINSPNFYQEYNKIRTKYLNLLNENKYDEANELVNNIRPYSSQVDSAVTRLHNIWELANKPIISNDPNPLTDEIPGMENRASIMMKEYGNNIQRNQTFRTPSLNKIIAELSHPIQAYYGNGTNPFLDSLLDDNSEPITGKYGNPQAMEYETHKVIQPKIENYIYSSESDSIKDIDQLIDYLRVPRTRQHSYSK